MHKRRRLTISAKKFSNKNYIVIIFFVLVVGLFSVINLRNNIHGDAKFHSLYAKDSVQAGKLIRHQPNSIYSFKDDGVPIYTPIAYPLTSESLFSLLYMLGGDTALKMYAPIMSGIIFLLIFLCLNEIGVLLGSILALIGVLAITERLVMTPLIEPFLVVVLLAGVFTLKKFFLNDRKSYLAMSCIFFGTAAAIKQQGLAATIFMLIFIAIYLTYKLVIRDYSSSQYIKLLFTILAIVTIVPSLALIDQTIRNGTIAFAPGSTTLPSSLPFKKDLQPFFNSKFTADPASLQARDQGIGYNKRARSFQAKVDGFFLAPFLFYRAGDSFWQTTGYSWILLLIIVVILLEFISKDPLIRKNPFFWGLLFFLLVEEILVSYVIKTPVHQYHPFGIILATVLLFFSALRLIRFSPRSLGTAFAVLIILFSVGYYSFAIPLWGNTGREDNYHLEGYKKIGQFAQNNTSKNAVFLAAETNFRYYSNRDIVWVNESMGKDVIEILNSNDPKYTMPHLQKLHINYVVIDKSQTNYSGLYDYLPPVGLINIVSNEKYFAKLYDPYSDGQMIVYKVRYGG